MKRYVVFDIGNTNVTLGIFEDEKIVFRARFASDTRRTLDEFENQLEQVIKRSSVAELSKAVIVVGSVVPNLTGIFLSLTEKLFQQTAFQVGPHFCAGIGLDVSSPNSVGADRIANAVAAGQLYSKPALVVDFGTATTFDLVGKGGAYEGGIIAPGPETSLAALVERTAKLHTVELKWPEKVVGKSTESAMQSGLVIGYMSLIDGLIERIGSEVGVLGEVIATGGLGELFVKHSKYMKIYDPDLTLHGLRIIGEVASGR